MTWHFLHVLGLALWFGSAGADVVLEGVLQRTPEGTAQRTLIRLHKIIDLVLEGPAIIVVLVTGLVLILNRPAPLPGWMWWKIGLGASAALANLICVFFVVARHRASSALDAHAIPNQSPPVRRWNIAIAITGVGVPAALGALWLGVTRL